VRPAGPTQNSGRDAAYQQVRQAALVGGAQRVGHHLQEDPLRVIGGFLGGGVALAVEGQAVSGIAHGSQKLVLADLGDTKSPEASKLGTDRCLRTV
jgi:hypothetical protein